MGDLFVTGAPVSFYTGNGVSWAIVSPASPSVALPGGVQSAWTYPGSAASALQTVDIASGTVTTSFGTCSNAVVPLRLNPNVVVHTLSPLSNVVFRHALVPPVTATTVTSLLSTVYLASGRLRTTSMTVDGVHTRSSFVVPQGTSVPSDYRDPITNVTWSMFQAQSTPVTALLTEGMAPADSLRVHTAVAGSLASLVAADAALSVSASVAVTPKAAAGASQLLDTAFHQMQLNNAVRVLFGTVPDASTFRELWVVPALLLLDAARARPFVDLRCESLPQAVARAAQDGFPGARYFDSLYQSALVSACVWDYYCATLDRTWLVERGVDVMRDVADYVCANVVYASNAASIPSVVDSAGNLATDHSLTNVTACLAVNYAVEAYAALSLVPKAPWVAMSNAAGALLANVVNSNGVVVYSPANPFPSSNDAAPVVWPLMYQGASVANNLATYGSQGTVGAAALRALLAQGQSGATASNTVTEGHARLTAAVAGAASNGLMTDPDACGAYVQLFATTYGGLSLRGGGPPVAPIFGCVAPAHWASLSFRSTAGSYTVVNQLTYP